MHIKPGTKLGGIPAVKVRDFVKRYRHVEWTQNQVEDELLVSAGTANLILLELLDKGVVRQDSRQRKEGLWSVSDTAGSFINANAAPQIHRKKAEELVKLVLTRVEEVNSRPHFLFRVEKLLVFGSFLSMKPLLGDVDLAIRLMPKVSDKDRHRELSMQRVQEACKSGRSFSTFLDQLNWPRREVELHLKQRSRYISLHNDDDEVLTKTASKILYPVIS